MLFKIAILYFKNHRIEIINRTIFEYNFWNHKKELGSLDEITSFCEFHHTVFVLKNYTKFFSFSLGKTENCQFYHYLKANYPPSIYLKATEQTPYWYYAIALLLIETSAYSDFEGFDIDFSICFVCSLFILIMIGINESKKYFQIQENYVIYQKLLINRKIPWTDLTKLVYRKRIRGSKFGTYQDYVVTGYHNNTKYFKIAVNPQNFKLIQTTAKKHDMKRVNKTNRFFW